LQGCWSGSSWICFHTFWVWRVADLDPFHLTFWVRRVADPNHLGSAFILLFGFAGLLILIHLDPFSFDFLGLQGCWSWSTWIRFHLTFWVCRVADPDPLGFVFIWLSGFAGLLIRIHLDSLSFDFLGLHGCWLDPPSFDFLGLHFTGLLIRIHLDPLSFDFLDLQSCCSGSTWIRSFGFLGLEGC
jgi:hypothetical protein